MPNQPQTDIVPALAEPRIVVAVGHRIRINMRMIKAMRDALNAGEDSVIISKLAKIEDEESGAVELRVELSRDTVGMSHL